MRIINRLLLTAVIISMLVFSVFAANDVPQAVIDAMESVVCINAEYPDYFSSGSGFIIKATSDRTLIATNNHVIEGNPISISVWINDKQTIKAHVLAASEQKDLCILELAYAIPENSLKLQRDGATKGEAVYAVGFPAAADYLSATEAHSSSDATITDGIVSATRKLAISDYGEEIDLLQINAAINPGNSGGPLFNAEGYVVGINTYKAVESEGINGAIEIGELIDFLADSEIELVNEEKDDIGCWLVIAAGVILVAVIVAIFLLKVKHNKELKKMPCAEDDCAKDTKERKRNTQKLRFAVIAFILIIAVLTGIYCLQYRKAKILAENGEFENANKTLLFSFVTDLHDKHFVDYLNAGTLLENGEYTSARTEFTKLGNYANSENFEKASRSKIAQQLAEANQFEDALSILDELQKEDYPTAAEAIQEVKFAQGVYELYTKNDYQNALAIFEKLDQSSYEPAKEMIAEARYYLSQTFFDEGNLIGAYGMLKGCPYQFEKNIVRMDELRDMIYQKAIMLYYDNEYSKCEQLLNAISPYEESDKYFLLCDVHEFFLSASYIMIANGGYIVGYEKNISEWISNLGDMEEFEDATLLLNDLQNALEKLTVNKVMY